ncbi:MAG: hypothetical protein ACK5JC_11890 [Bacteroidota bacterium]
MNALLGLDDKLLKQTGAIDQAGYKMVNTLFLAVLGMSLFANAYFGYLMARNVWGTLLMALFMGYIQFSCIRIALITLMTRPLCEPAQKSIVSDPAAKLYKRVWQIIRQLNGASILRFVFVGCMAIAISIPFSAMFFHKRGMTIEEAYRNDLLRKQTESAHLLLNGLDADIREANYPFVIFRTLSGNPLYKILVLIFMVVVYAPLFALSRLRYGIHNQYTKLLRTRMEENISRDYAITVADMQGFMNRQFPDFPKTLDSLTAFADAPFNQKPFSIKQRTYGDAEGFRDYLESL